MNIQSSKSLLTETTIRKLQKTVVVLSHDGAWANDTDTVQAMDPNDLKSMLEEVVERRSYVDKCKEALQLQEKLLLAEEILLFQHLQQRMPFVHEVGGQSFVVTTRSDVDDLLDGSSSSRRVHLHPMKGSQQVLEEFAANPRLAT